MKNAIFEVVVNKCCGCDKPFGEKRTLTEMGENWSIEGFCSECLPKYLKYLGPRTYAPSNTDEYRDRSLQDSRGDHGYRTKIAVNY